MKLKDKWQRGLPYVGNKGQKVEQIMKALPSGKRKDELLLKVIK
ncbi:hypothetical protein [Limosilactobacillus reuteri]